MENKPSAFGSLFQTAGDYLETRVELLKLQAVNKSSDVVSSLVSIIIIAIIALLGFIILNIGLALWLSFLLGEAWYGFFVVGGFYLLLSLIMISAKGKWIKTPVNDLLIKKILN